jgi:hypothetical protein
MPIQPRVVVQAYENHNFLPRKNTDYHGEFLGMDSILCEKFLDRIYRIHKVIFDHFPEENGQTLSPSAKEYLPIHWFCFEIVT